MRNPFRPGGSSRARSTHTRDRASRAPSTSHSGGGSVARDTAVSHPCGGRRSLRPRSTVTRESPRAPTALRRNATRRSRGSTSVIRIRGRSIAITSPGAPAPLPTSTHDSSSDDCAEAVARTAASARVRSTSSSAVRAAVRSVLAFQRTTSSRYGASDGQATLGTPRCRSASRARKTSGSHREPRGSRGIAERLPPRARAR